MGIWDHIRSINGTLRRNTPDSTAYRDTLRRSYDNSRSAVIKNLTRHLPDDEARSEIFKFVSIAAKIACDEVLKLIPGGVTAYNIFSRSRREYEKSKNNIKKRKASQAKDKPESLTGKNEDEPENSTKEEEEETENSTKKEKAEKESSGGKARRLRSKM
ncbi:hypothetical protein L1049_001098 [Liquidambar formosana]|uniref:Uncharacterized protein n=1 Tax=Liquidambar formosana TaxID=63359 RepID=A0AAP0NA00_LIQFO